MSSYLTCGYPSRVNIEGEQFEITTDYRDCIKAICALEDGDLTLIEKQSILLHIMYHQIPSNLEMAIKKAILFLNCGEEGTESCGTRVYSFRQDDKYIFAAVDKVLHGRLSLGEAVHWWEFVSAFMEMPEDCVMSKIIYYRTRYASGKLTKEEKDVWRKNVKLFMLNSEETQEEKNAKNEFISRLLGNN